MSRDLCRECQNCKAREDGLCYYCIDSSSIDAPSLLEGAA